MSDPKTTHHVLLKDDEGAPFSHEERFEQLAAYLRRNPNLSVRLTDPQTLLEVGIVTVIAANDSDAIALIDCYAVESVNPNRL